VCFTRILGQNSAPTIEGVRAPWPVTGLRELAPAATSQNRTHARQARLAHGAARRFRESRDHYRRQELIIRVLA
jgi:hypothetical protein